jgi:hypothetical protein
MSKVTCSVLRLVIPKNKCVKKKCLGYPDFRTRLILVVDASICFMSISNDIALYVCLSHFYELLVLNFSSAPVLGSCLRDQALRSSNMAAATGAVFIFHFVPSCFFVCLGISTSTYI